MTSFPLRGDRMKKWYLWLVLALVFAVSGIINYFDGRSVLAQVIQVSIAVILAFIQLLCDRKGAKGKKLFNYIAMVLSAVLGIWIIAMIVDMLI